MADRPFELDPFQIEAMAAVDAGRSVLVAAPTSSGKTVVAEHAVDRALAGGQRAFYTAPIKALSNQKFRDLGRRLGVDRVGLMTGDQVVLPDAPVVVMTTEVLRNMLYAGSAATLDLGWVVLDEVHFLEDPYRGAVWEEVVLNLAPEVGMVALSATVSNASELGDWLTAVRGPTDVVVETRRPVKLRTHYLVAERGQQRRLHRLATHRGGSPNTDGRRFDNQRGGGQRGGRGRGSRWVTPRRDEVLGELTAHGLLPAIHFIFSRAGCDEARDGVLRDGIRLNNTSEAAAVSEHVMARLDGLPAADLGALGVQRWIEGLECGVASHHAGLVPIFKEVTEELFAMGLLKIVYATETLALGVNLPARSVVIDKLTKFTGQTHEVLTPGQFTQLTGRAGRRGMDTEGHAIVCWSPFVPFDQVSGLAGSRDFVLRSAFRPTYNMVANLIVGRSRAQADDLLARSFAQFQLDRQVAKRHRRSDEMRAEAARIREELADRGSIEGEPVQPTALGPGDVVVLDDGLAHLVLSVAHRSGGRRRLKSLDQAGRMATMDPGDLVRLPVKAGEVELPAPFSPDRPEFRRAAMKRLRPFATEGDDDSGARRRLARLERNLGRLADEPAAGALTDRLDASLHVLEERGLAEGWTLTARGRPLTAIHNEADLLVVEVMAAGLLEDLSPGMLAALISSLTFRKRGPGDPSTIRLGGDFPSRFAAILSLASEVAEVESAFGMKPAQPPDPGFAHVIHAWAGGGELEEVLDPDMVGGEFVRNVRLVADLLRQISKVAPDELGGVAEVAGVRLVRGVVAMSAGAPSVDVDPDTGESR
jgi:ATP-dependent RNA helicase HelY